MRWKIYENEAIDCQQEMHLLQNKKDAGKLVQKHLQGELEDAKHRLEMVGPRIYHHCGALQTHNYGICLCSLLF